MSGRSGYGADDAAGPSRVPRNRIVEAASGESSEQRAVVAGGGGGHVKSS